MCGTGICTEVFELAIGKKNTVRELTDRDCMKFSSAPILCLYYTAKM